MRAVLHSISEERDERQKKYGEVQRDESPWKGYAV